MGVWMRRALSFLTFSCLLAVGVIWAGDAPSVDFDKKVDSTGIVEHAKRRGKMRRAMPLNPIATVKKLPAELEAFRVAAATLSTAMDSPVAREKGRLPLPTLACDQMPPSADDPGGETPSLCLDVRRANSASKIESAMGYSPITGPYEPLPRDNEDYKQTIDLKEKLGTAGEGFDTSSLKESAKAGSIPGPVRNALLTRWIALDQERTNLILAARPLDSDDESLYRFAVRINTWYDRIVARKRILDSNIADYNRLCLGRELPRDEYEQCEAYRARGNRCIELHNASLAENDRLVGIWQSGKKCLEARGTDFRTWVLNWINQVIKPWIGDARKALDDACGKLKTIALVPAAPKVPTGGKSLIFKAWPTFEDGAKPCPVSYLWRADPAIGNLSVSPASQLVATLTSGASEAVGEVVVDGADTVGGMAKGTSKVSVVDRVQPCEIENHSCRPLESGLIQNLCSYYCCGSRDQEVHNEPTCNRGNCPTRFCVP